MLDRASDDRWFVRRTPDGEVLAVVEAFGVHTSAELAETAWWRHLDRGRGQHAASTSESRRRLGDD